MDYSLYSNPHTLQKKMPQTQPIPGRNQIVNAAGGYGFAVDKWDALDRFVILGSEGGTYYASEKKLSTDNIKNIRACIAEDGVRVVDRIVELSQSGRAPKNDPALFVLALVASDKAYAGNRQWAMAALPKIARTGTHLFHFAQFVTAQRGWGRALKRGIANWYLDKSHDDLAYQLMKYKSRDGWAHADLIKLSHPKTDDSIRNEFLRNTVHPEVPFGPIQGAASERYAASQEATHSDDAKKVCELISKYNLPHEVINRDLLKNPQIWDALLWHMPLTAMIRNLGRLTHLGLLGQGSRHAKHVVSQLGNIENLKRSRVHPITLLAALKTYQSCRGMTLTWDASRAIVDALDDAFYKAFDLVTPTGKRILMGIDISGSMFGNTVNGMASLDAASASAAMALVTMKVEKGVIIKGFTSATGGYSYSSDFRDLKISPRMTLDAVLNYMRTLSMGGTDCSLPMKWATQTKTPIDTFVVYTDNETYGGQSHVCQALKVYRDTTGIGAKLIVAGVTSTGFTVADPDDKGMLDVVGFDSATPQIMADFMRA